MERRYCANEQYSRRECLEISGIPASVADNGFESKVLEILEEIDVPIDTSLVEDCHCLYSTSIYVSRLQPYSDSHWAYKFIFNGTVLILLLGIY